jgi:glycosyltransferase involved in cell wall biosynthesis
MKIAMVVHNALDSDPRVEREATALARAGNDVAIVAIWEPERTPKRERRGAFSIRRVSRRPFFTDLIRQDWIPIIYKLRAWRATPMRATPIAPFKRGARAVISKSLIVVIRALTRALRIFVRVLPKTSLRQAIDTRMAFALLAEKPDVVHAHDLNTLRPAAIAARLAHAKLVYDSHEISPGLPHVQDMQRVVRYERKWIARADAVIHTTPMRGKWAADTYGIAMPHIVRNIPEMQGDVRPVDLAREAGFAPGTKVVMHQGNMQPARGLEALTLAMGKLDNGYGLLMLGKGKLQPELEALVAEHGLGERVRFHAPVPHDELLAWTASAWCGVSLLVDVCLNHKYSLPNKLFEYVAVGVPVVASNNVEIAAFVNEHRVGEVCDPTDPASIADAIARLAERRDDAAQAARAAANVYRWENEERTLLGIYAALKPSR